MGILILLSRDIDEKALLGPYLTRNTFDFECTFHVGP